MKYLATLSIAAVLGLGFAGVASAAPVDEIFVIEQTAPIEVQPGTDPYHVCHGRSSGTAHAACGTATGGPSGGLF